MPPNDPKLVRRLVLARQLGGPDSGPGNSIGVLPQGILEAVAELAQAPHGGLRETLGGAAGLALPQDHTGPQDNGVVEAELPDGILHPLLHLAVGGPAGQEAVGAGAGDEYKRGDAGFLGRLGQLDVEVVVNLALVLETAGLGARGAQGGEDGGWGGREAGQRGGPFGSVGVDDGAEVRRGGLGGAAGDCVDGLVDVAG